MTKIHINHEKYIKQVKWSEFVEDCYIDKLIKEQENGSDLRILKIIKSCKELLTELVPNVRKLLVTSPNFFFLILEVPNEDLIALI